MRFFTCTYFMKLLRVGIVIYDSYRLPIYAGYSTFQYHSDFRLELRNCISNWYNIL